MDLRRPFPFFMKPLIAFIIVTIFIFSATHAENLAAIAKKEKARRQALAAEGKKSRVLTNDDIPKLKATLGIDVNRTSGPAPKEPAQENTSSNDEQKSELDEKIKVHNEEIEKMKNELEEARQNAGSGGIYHSTNLGSQYREIRENEELLKDLEEEKANLEKEKQEKESDQQPN